MPDWTSVFDYSHNSFLRVHQSFLRSSKEWLLRKERQDEETINKDVTTHLQKLLSLVQHLTKSWPNNNKPPRPIKANNIFANTF